MIDNTTTIVPARSALEYDEAKILIQEYARGLGIDLCFQKFAEELQGLRDTYGAPQGGLWLARVAGAPVGCVGMRALSADVAEIKRLYGIGKALARTAVMDARGRGYKRVVLDTLPQMESAQHIYQALGFRDAQPYYAKPLSGVRYMMLELEPS